MIFKIINESLYICDSMGNLRRRISENVSFGTFDEDTSIFLITKTDGKLELKDINGNLRRVLIGECIEARFLGKEIIARKIDGRTCMLDRMGNIRRYL